jgi:hypothetical protein
MNILSANEELAGVVQLEKGLGDKNPRSGAYSSR